MQARFRRFFSLIPALCVILLLAGCTAPAGNAPGSATLCGLDLSAGDVLSSIDTHDGFHGDGLTYQEITFADDSLQEQLEASALWLPLPLPSPLQTLIYGTFTDGGQAGPYICKPDTVGEALFPYVENGCYYFEDRHSQSTAPYDPGSLFDRSSFNLTFALYDADTRTLYYCEFDT